MPYKDIQERREYAKKYNSNLSEDQKEAKRLATKNWWKSPKGKYTTQRSDAKRRGIKWEFTFDSWFKFWLDSGKWEQRSPTGYCMCRFKDEGPYSVDNVYIDLASNNKKDAWDNNKICIPAGYFKKDL